MEISAREGTVGYRRNIPLSKVALTKGAHEVIAASAISPR